MGFMKNFGGRGGSGVRVKLEIYASKVDRRIKNKQRKVLFALGKYLKTTMQRSMRYRKGPSKPGQPPSAHKKTGAPLRSTIRFEVDLVSGSVVAGPLKFHSVSQPSGKPVPELIDKGGPVFAELKGVSVVANIAPRPFTAPVFTDGGKRFNELLEEIPI